MATILNRENEALALFNTKGLFCEPELIIGKCLPMKPSCTLENYILSHFPTMSNTLVDFIRYKGIPYSTRFYHSILLKHKETKTFSVGVIRKIIVSNSNKSVEKIEFVYQFSKLTPIETFGLYHVTLLENFGTILVDELADFYPIYLFNKNDNKDETDSLYLSLLTKPYLE